MKYKDKGGQEMEIAYSTQVQEKLVNTLQENAKWRRKLYYTLNTIKWALILLIILGGLLFIYLDNRNMLTFFGRKLFCA
jgi:type VI protein secretion system component VasK